MLVRLCCSDTVRVERDYMLRPRESLNLRSRKLNEDALVSLPNTRRESRSRSKSTSYRGIRLDEEHEEEMWVRFID